MKKINKLLSLFFINIIASCALNACQESPKKQTPKEKLELALKLPTYPSAKEQNELIEQAIKEGLDPNTKINGNKSSLLTYFTDNKEIFLAKLLLDAKANPNSTTGQGLSALSCATSTCGTSGKKKTIRAETTKLLLDAKADPNFKEKFYDMGGTTFTHTAWDIDNRYRQFGKEENEDNEVIQLLLDAKADSNAKNNEGDTALICATKHKNKKMVERLLDAMVDIEIKNNANKTALDIAQENGSHEIAKMLKDEPKRRLLLKQAVQEVSKYLPDVLANIVSEYVIRIPVK